VMKKIGVVMKAVNGIKLLVQLRQWLWKLYTKTLFYLWSWLWKLYIKHYFIYDHDYENYI
jgi:hypothetical protein